MTVGDHAARTYVVGDVVYLEIDVSDASGVAGVSVYCAPEGTTNWWSAPVVLQGHGGWETAPTVTLNGRIGAAPPGVYTSIGAKVYDGVGNVSYPVLSPAASFVVEAPPTPDTQGPDVSGWGFA